MRIAPTTHWRITSCLDCANRDGASMCIAIMVKKGDVVEGAIFWGIV